MPTQSSYCFGPYVIDADRRLLLKDGVPVPLPEAGMFEMPFLLVSRSGEVVSNEELAAARRLGQQRAAAMGMLPMTDTERQAFIASIFSEPDDTKK